MDPTLSSPAKMLGRQARFDYRIDHAVEPLLTRFLADVQALAVKDGLYLSAGDVAAAWDEATSFAVLNDRLPVDVAEYVAEGLTGEALPDAVYETATTILRVAADEQWSVAQTAEALSIVFDPDAGRTVLTAALVQWSELDLKAKAKRLYLPDTVLGRLKRKLKIEFKAGLKEFGPIWAMLVAQSAREARRGLFAKTIYRELQEEGVQSKMWVSRRDDRVRDTHRIADGQVVPLGESFNVGGYALEYPGDRNGPIEETINCRCVIVAVD